MTSPIERVEELADWSLYEHDMPGIDDLHAISKVVVKLVAEIQRLKNESQAKASRPEVPGGESDTRSGDSEVSERGASAGEADTGASGVGSEEQTAPTPSPSTPD